MSAAQKLTPRQAKFVKLYCLAGNGLQAALGAGYPLKTAQEQSWAMVRKPHILEEIKREVQKRLDAGAAVGAAVLLDLAQSATSESVRVDCAKALLAHGGMAPKLLRQVDHRHVVVDQRSDAELRERIRQLSGELGLNSRLIEHEPALQLPALDIADAVMVERDIFE